MSMKEDLETWVTALKLYDAFAYSEAIEAFEPITDTSKIYFNCGVIRATLGEHAAAVQYYRQAINLDKYFAIAYFQQGVSNFLMGDFEEALVNFNDTLTYLRGNKYIDYEQLGLKYKLHSCEAVFNRGLCYIYLQQKEVGMRDLHAALNEKATKDHEVIDEAIRDEAKGYITFSIPVGLVFRPHDAKIKNIMARDYLGKARLVAQAPPEGYHKRQMSADTWARDDRDPGQISYAASNLVRTGLVSRSRQQSEPPLHRNMFPPTPPPETDKYVPQSTRAVSPGRLGPDGRSKTPSRTRPEPLELGKAAFKVAASSSQQPARRGAARSASERPPDRRPQADRRSTEPERHSTTRERLFGAIDSGDGHADLIIQLQQHDINNGAQSYLSTRSKQSRPDLIQEEEEGNDHYTPMITSSNSTIPEVREDSDTIPSHRTASYRGTSRRGQPAMTKIRLKAHFNDETRYIILVPKVTYAELTDQIARKFAINRGLKIKMRDEEGDMITLGDQDDLDMTLTTCKEQAAKEGADMGKMELWIHALSPR